MKYVVLFKRGEQSISVDEWFDNQKDAETRKSELKGMFDWVDTHNPKSLEPVSVWVECAELC
jgi:hypothetical protein